jgi:hypothetical protein
MAHDGTHEQSAPKRVDFAGINALSSRAPGYAVALKCLEVQAAAELHDPTLKADEHVRLHPDAWSWYQGAIGEIEVGKLLGALAPEWFVRHSVPIGAGTKDVDHLVIGPGGVFAINTKHHAGASVWVGDYVLRVNGSNTSHLKAGRGDASDVSRRLSEKVGFPVPVTPIVAVLNAESLTDRRPAHNRPVQVVDASRLVHWIQSQPSQLSPAKIELIKLAAEEPQTWHVDPHAADTLRVMQRFERLVDRVSITSGATAHQRAATSRPRPPRTARPAPASRPRRMQPRAKSMRSSRKRAADEKNIAQLWAYGVAVLAAVIYGTHKVAACASETTSAATGFQCAVVEGLRSFYPFGWWLAGGLLVLALGMTVIHTRRR